MQLSSETPGATYPTLAELTPTHWQAGVVKATDGAELHYIRTGGGKPALLLLHGVQGAGLMWLRTAQALADSYDVVMPDIRGHGASSRVAGELAVDILVTDAITIVNALGLEQPAVIGHSMGADIAGRLAAVYQPRGLVLVDPALRDMSASMAFDFDNPPPWMAAMFATLRELPTLPHAERMASARRLLPPGTPDWDPADYVSFVEAMAQFDLEFYRSTAALGYLCTAPEVLAQINCPTLLLTARPFSPDIDVAAAAAAFLHNLQTARHIHFADSGHAIMYDQFARFVDVVRKFLAELSA